MSVWEELECNVQRLRACGEESAEDRLNKERQGKRRSIGELKKECNDEV